MLTPIGCRVLVKQLEAEDISEGGIIIPDTSRERPPEGEIVEVGSDVKYLAKGMRVLFRKWSPKSFVVSDSDGTELIVMDEEEALAVRHA